MGVQAAHCSSSLYQSGSLALSMGRMRPESEKSSMLQQGSGRSLKAMAASGRSVQSYPDCVGVSSNGCSGERV